MKSIDNIINNLKGKTKTLGWDAVVAYDRDKINQLLQQQYVKKLANGTHLPPITWVSEKKDLYLKDVTFSEPLISFTNSDITNSRATVFLEFIDGTISEVDTNGQPTYHTRLRPGMGLGMELNVDLISGQGGVDERGIVKIDFSKAAISVINIINEPPSELIAVIQSWLVNNPVSYEVGQISMEELSATMTPKKFIIRTQQAPENARSNMMDTGYGAILLFIATEQNPNGGNLPSNTYPWIIPADHSSAILINNHLIMKSFIKPAMDKMLASGQWELSRGTEEDDAFILKATNDAVVRTDYIRVKGSSSRDTDATWSGNYYASTEIHEDFKYSLKGSSLSFDKNKLLLKFDSSNYFKQPFAGKWTHCATGPNGQTCGLYWERRNLELNIEGTVEYLIESRSGSETIQIIRDKNNTKVHNDFKNSFQYADAVMSGKLDDVLNNAVQFHDAYLEKVSFEDINIFAINHILFPEQNVNTLASVYMPGDLIVFGKIAPSLTSIRLEPLTTTVSAGDTVQFSALPASDIKYSLSPADAGSISASGLYQAPDALNAGSLGVLVTATGPDGVSASSYITVIPKSVVVTPSFIAIKENDIRSVKLNAIVFGENNDFSGWKLDSTVSGMTGSITSEGWYTPPDLYPDDYPLGYTYVTATAMASNGDIAKVYIMLINHQTIAEFNVMPNLTVDMNYDSTLELSAKSTLDFSPDLWSLYPQIGNLSKPELNDGKYTVEYSAPAEVDVEDIAVVSVMQSGKPHRAGYAFIDFKNRVPNTWSLIEGVSILKIVSESGGGHAQIYKNGKHQAAVTVQFQGFRLNNNTPEIIKVSMEDILPHIQLIDHVSGEPLNWLSEDSWYYTSQENEFERFPIGNYSDRTYNEGANNFTFYVSCDPAALSSSKKIAVKVTLANGTVISTASNATSGFNSSVLIDALPKIDYSQVSSFVLSNDTMRTLKSIGWEYNPVNTGLYEPMDELCTISRQTFTLKPTSDAGNRFHEIKYISQNINNYDVSSFLTRWNGFLETTFSCLDDNSHSPCTVLGVSDEPSSGEANIWFPGGNAQCREGSIHFISNDKQTRYRVTIPEFLDEEDTEGVATLTLIKVKTPNPDMKPFEWASVNPPLVLSVTDIYGNRGSITMHWDEKYNFNIPSIWHK